MRYLLPLLELAVRGVASPLDLLRLIGYLLPNFLTLTIPMAVLIGILLGLSRLACRQRGHGDACQRPGRRLLPADRQHRRDLLLADRPGELALCRSARRARSARLRGAEQDLAGHRRGPAARLLRRLQELRPVYAGRHARRQRHRHLEARLPRRPHTARNAAHHQRAGGDRAGRRRAPDASARSPQRLTPRHRRQRSEPVRHRHLRLHGPAHRNQLAGGHAPQPSRHAHAGARHRRGLAARARF